MSVLIRRSWILILTLALSVQLGCLKAPPEDTETDEGRKEICEYWPEKLTVASKVEKAFQMITEAKCSSALPKLEELFDKNVERARIIDAVRAIGDKNGAIGILRKGLKDGDVAPKAATIAASWRLSELTNDLVAFTESSEDQRRAALDALLAVSDAKNHEDLLIRLTKTSPNLQDLKVNDKALTALAKMGSKKGAAAIVTAAFMRSNHGQHIYPAARRALAKLPKEAVNSLIKVQAGTLTPVNVMAKEIGIPSWEIRGNQILPQLLADTLDRKAAVPSAKILASPRSKPLNLSEKECVKNPRGHKCKQYQTWNRYWINQHQYAHLAFGKLPPDDEAAELLTKLVMSNGNDFDTKMHRLFAANALSYMGSPAAIKGLLKAWDEDPDWNRDKKDSQRRADFLAILTRPLLMAIGYKDLGELEKRWEKPERYVSMFEHVSKRVALPNVKSMLAALRECKMDGACWIKLLDDSERDVFIKAVFMLTRPFVNASDARKALLARLKKTKDSDSDHRKFCLMGLARIGDKKTGEALIEMSKSPAVTKQNWKDEFTVLANALIARNP
jgi:hypothetical protein